MAARQDINFYFSMILLAAFIAYVTYHAFSGERGIAALVRLDQTIYEKRAELEKLVLEQRRMENRVERMRTESLDLDLLEEQARRVLGYAKPNEFILVPPSSSSITR